MTVFEGLLPRPVRVTPTGGTLHDPPAPTFAKDLSLPPSGFRLTVSSDGVHVESADPAGEFYGFQALRQLRGPAAFRAVDLPGDPLPCGVVEDWPRFSWRGCLLDVARHFMPKYAVLRFLDLMAAHRLNVLHLHLTDDQGWRLEVPEYPKLTTVGAWRAGSWTGRPPDGTPGHDGRPHGGYYTVDDLREIVAYAAERHITVVPEIDVPGHSQAAIAAYPWLGVTGERLEVLTRWGVNENVLAMTDEVVDFYRRVLTHVTEIFPSEVICLGGDEVPATQWAADPGSVDRAADLGLSNVDSLHGWFVAQLATHLESLGRRASVWDEALSPRLPPRTIVAAWHPDVDAGGHDVVLCPEDHLYLDHRQSDHPSEPIPVGYLRTLADVYAYEPSASALGAQAQVWSEHLDSPRRVDYAAFPRLAAFAEVVWSGPDRSYEEFEQRLIAHHLPRLDALGVEYRPLAGPHPWQTRPGVPGRPR
ncbi:beta-N-acetylhexosaminidase [Actinophytocola algeriensis]|uniref:beta-N-acetylhexosaminidase n=1 Tax=Actinophytocola algeriensis TaxID=1768010 RepID=A0A7W7QAI1_9PSEU|nr:beta-N-acetylhexosaminidase [Actinophytocola algeriensis]MBB4909999.1 hexosaminidase [Actinophytocola algeriensis]MBE1475989.1 hexosaminidase [Actinophytocola algeriensis]